MKQDRINEAVMALLYFGIYNHNPVKGARTWKPFDQDAMGCLHEKGLISNPVSKTRSVTLTESGLRPAEEADNRVLGADD